MGVDEEVVDWQLRFSLLALTTGLVLLSIFVGAMLRGAGIFPPWMSWGLPIVFFLLGGLTITHRFRQRWWKW